ncbi:MAG TPA: prepilin-type N-terminal cleavage/methylation domain-containing protein [Chthoniobacteraceae bacterium]|nr:prepilin-type N-terminal cleavage/methylation domain-containing protein [Chthoniobacteraceae bacterium]
MGRTGYTVVELLLVIGLLAVLSVLGMVISDRMTQHSREVRCIHHLRQLYQGIMLFANDYGGRVPFGVTYGEDGKIVTYRSYPDHGRQFKDYVPGAPAGYTTGYADPYLCPADGIRNPPRGVGRGYFGHSYGANSVLALEDNARIANWRTPSQTFMLADGISTMIFQTDPDRYIAPRHQGKANFIFLDGHVRSLRPPWPRRTVELSFWNPGTGQ